MDRGAWWATVHGITKSQTQLKRLSTQSEQKFILRCRWSSSECSPRAGSQVGVGSGPTAVGVLDRPQGGVPGIHLPDTPIYPIPVSHPPLLLMGTAPSSRSKVVPDFAVKSWGPPRWQARPCYPLSPPIHHHGGEPRVGLSRNREPTRLPTASRMAQAHTTPDLR